jgi:hypothetical protein
MLTCHIVHQVIVRRAPRAPGTLRHSAQPQDLGAAIDSRLVRGGGHALLQRKSVK